MPFQIVRQDITKMAVDAIVNAANTGLQMGGGVCGAIFRAAGAGELQEACSAVAPIQTGGAAITPGFRLPARFVIHAAGPVYSAQNRDRCRDLLYDAYTSSLDLALENRCESIAFPLISAGIFGYPKAEALQVATDAIRDFLSRHDMEVYLCIFDRDSFLIGTHLLGAVKSYIDDHYVNAHTFGRSDLPRQRGQALQAADHCPPMAAAMPSAAAKPEWDTAHSLDELVGRLDEPFSATLLKLIDAKGMTDPEVYKKANLDRKLFSKIRTGHGYTPRKPTILALAIALELTLEETDDLLERAGYALSHASKFDVIVEYFIVSGNYDIFALNQVLFQYDLPLLGS